MTKIIRCKYFVPFVYGLCFCIFSSLSYAEHNADRELWGKANNKQVYLYRVTNKNGMRLEMTNYGAKITSLYVPDSNGKLDDVVLGFDSLEGYMRNIQGIGATIGRYTNRIRNAQFTIDNVTYNLTKNDGDNTIHGGNEFSSAVFTSKIVHNDLGTGIEFTYFSKAGSHGFPGNLSSVITYTLTNNNEVHISFDATTDAKTHVNFTNHSYFNLNGMQALIYDHLVQINSNKYVELDDEVLATGRILTTTGTPWDLSQLTRIGDKIKNIPLNGYHHNYVFDKPKGQLRKVAKVIEPNSGRTLDVSTTQSGVTFYASMGLKGEFRGKKGIKYDSHIAFCLETQEHVGAANIKHFPSTLLKPNEKYHEVVIYDFGVVDKIDNI